MAERRNPPRSSPIRSATRWLGVVIPVLFLVTACGGGDGSSPSAPGPACTSIAGQWTVGLADACGTNREVTVNVTQNACLVQFSAPLVGQVQGRLRSSTNPDLIHEADLSVEPPASCGGGASAGILRVTSVSEMTMQWGTGEGCCRHGSAFFNR